MLTLFLCSFRSHLHAKQLLISARPFAPLTRAPVPDDPCCPSGPGENGGCAGPPAPALNEIASFQAPPPKPPLPKQLFPPAPPMADPAIALPEFPPRPPFEHPWPEGIVPPAPPCPPLRASAYVSPRPPFPPRRRMLFPPRPPVAEPVLASAELPPGPPFTPQEPGVPRAPSGVTCSAHASPPCPPLPVVPGVPGLPTDVQTNAAPCTSSDCELAGAGSCGAVVATYCPFSRNAPA